MFKALGLSAPQSASLRDLYSSDPSSRLSILRTLSTSDLPESLLPVDSSRGVMNVLCMICLRFPTASEESEPLIVASFLTQVSKESTPFPALVEGANMKFCAKTMVALSLFMPAMKRRMDRTAAPSPDYYRSVASGILSSKSPAHRAVAAHHRAWENFLHECLAPSS